jgi:beta-lactamase regulating signal transducer with metallopeptidase domain
MTYGFLLSGAVRAAVVLALGFVACALLSRAAASTRRFVLALTLGAAIVVPLASAAGPRWTVEAPAALSIFAHESDSESASSRTPAREAAKSGGAVSARAAASSSPFALDTAGALVLAWLLGATALLARAVTSQLRTRAVVRRATRVASASWLDAIQRAAAGHSVEIKVSSELDSPAVMGLFHPTIVVPREALDWSLERCRLVLVHELAHIRHRDVLVQAVADLACALHWGNPLVWICARRLRMEREIAADDAVLAAGVQPSRYAEELVAVATSLAMPSALAMAERSSLETRVTSILASRLARAPLAARGTFAVVAAGTALATIAACASPHVSAPQPVTSGLAPRSGTANDAAIQRVADEEVATLEASLSPELATIVVLDPATGEILANAGRSAGKAADVATTTAIVPGSTLKPVTIAAALELHAIKVDQKFECGPDPRMYGDKALHDAHATGTLDLAHLLAVSSNIGTSHIFDALGGDNLAMWLHRFHFGETPSVPGAATGTFPAHIGNGTYEGAVVALGEGLTATPLQMAAAYGAIASDGVYHAPTLERGGSTAERLVSSETAKSVMALLEAAVTDESATGKDARVEGVHVAGKTGTAQWTAPDGHDRTYASFIGIADLPSRRIVALVGIQTPRDDVYGGKDAAPVFARLVSRLR